MRCGVAVRQVSDARRRRLRRLADRGVRSGCGLASRCALWAVFVTCVIAWRSRRETCILEQPRCRQISVWARSCWWLVEAHDLFAAGVGREQRVEHDAVLGAR